MAERFVFFGSAGFCLLAALLIERWTLAKGGGSMAVLRNVKALVVIIFIALVYSVITINRNNDWIDNYTLYKTDLVKLPNDSRLYYYLGDEILTEQVGEKDPERRSLMAQQSVDYLTKALAIYPDYMKAHCDLGNAYLNLSNYDSAEMHYRQGLRLSPKQVGIIRIMGHLYFVEKRYQLAIEYNKLAIQIDPDYAITYANTALAYQRLGNYDSAIYYSTKATIIDPRFFGSYDVLASTYRSIGQIDSATKYEALLRQYSQR